MALGMMFKMLALKLMMDSELIVAQYICTNTALLCFAFKQISGDLRISLSVSISLTI